MTGADKRRQGLALHGKERFFEGNSFVAGKDRLADADQSIPVSYLRRDMGDFITPRFPLFDRSSQASRKNDSM